MNRGNQAKLASLLVLGIGIAVLTVAPASIVSAHRFGTHEYHVGDAFLAALDPSFAPAVATASNGDRIEVSGSGTFSVHPNKVTGGGTFVHKDASGNVKGSGTWDAVQLLGYHSYGDATPQGLPAEFEGGRLILRVHLTASGGGPEFDGLLIVTCELGNFPPGVKEGIRLYPFGAPIQFNKEAGGATLFIRTP